VLADSSEDVEEEEQDEDDDDDDDDNDDDGEVDTSVDDTAAALISDQNTHDLSYYRFSIFTASFIHSFIHLWHAPL